MRGEVINTTDASMKLRNSEEKKLWREVQNAVKDVTKSMQDTYALNTVISTLTKVTNSLHSLHPLDKLPDNDKGVVGAQVRYKSVNTLLRMLAPIAPAFAEECWESLHQFLPEAKGTKVLEKPWPRVDEVALQHVDEMIKCAVQINGKVRVVIDVEKKKILDVDNAISYLKKMVMETPEGKKWLGGEKELQQVIMARTGKTVNFVI